MQFEGFPYRTGGACVPMRPEFEEDVQDDDKESKYAKGQSKTQKPLESEAGDYAFESIEVKDDHPSKEDEQIAMNEDTRQPMSKETTQAHKAGPDNGKCGRVTRGPREKPGGRHKRYGIQKRLVRVF